MIVWSFVRPGARRVWVAFAPAMLVLGAWPAVKLDAKPGGSAHKPALGRTAVVTPVVGKVLVRQKGSRAFTPLVQPRAVALGATIDTTRGTVQVTTASAETGKTHSGAFDGGAFTVTQEQSGLTDLTLVGGRNAVRACGLQHSRRGPDARASISSRVLRLLHARVHGPFRTVGRFTAATVRGTNWLTEDTCSGTLTQVQRGTVVATHRRSSQLVRLTPGSSLPTSLLLDCAFAGFPSFGSTCLSAQTRTGPGLFDLELDTSSVQGPYELCVTAPTQTERCGTFTLGARGADARAYSVVGCYVAKSGLYRARWMAAGRQLGVALLFSMPRPPISMPLGGGACVDQATMLIPGTNLFTASDLTCPPFRYAPPVALVLQAPPPGCPGSQSFRHRRPS